MTSFSDATFVLFLKKNQNTPRLSEAAALRSIVLRYAGAPIATCVSFFFPFVNLDMPFFRVFFCAISLSLCIGSTSYVLSFQMMVFYLVTTGWIFDISLFNVRIQSINQINRRYFQHAHFMPIVDME